MLTLETSTTESFPFVAFPKTPPTEDIIELVVSKTLVLRSIEPLVVSVSPFSVVCFPKSIFTLVKFPVETWPAKPPTITAE